MFRLLGASLTAILLWAATPAPPAVSNDAQIRQIADDFAAAWNKHDPTTMAYLWSADGDLINPFGKKAKGLTEIQRLLQDEHNGPMKSSTLTVTATSIRMLEPALAVLDEDVEVANVTLPDGSAATLKHHVVFVVRKTNGKWWIVNARPYAFTPAPPPPAPK